jgi:hypothetical protein
MSAPGGHAAATSEFRCLMISAMYENGGNAAQRFLDGHPGLFVYPFESQLGTRWVVDPLSSMFPLKYRWPEFALDATPEDDFHAVIDEETRVRARTPQVSKFRHVAFELSDGERAAAYAAHVARSGRSRARNVEAFFRATFEVWKNRRASGAERAYVGYSPIVVVDADKILGDLPAAHLLHVVRNPWSAYADTKRRPVPLPLRHYMLGWVVTQHCARIARTQQPGRVHVVRAEDLFGNPRATLGPVCDALGVGLDPALDGPTWNGERIAELAPWGTIRHPTPDANRATAFELAERERAEIRALAGPYLDAFDYTRFLG